MNHSMKYTMKYSNGMGQRFIILLSLLLAFPSAFASKILIDIREWDEIQEGIIDQALWLPTSLIDKEPSVIKTVLGEPNSKDEWQVYCRSGRRAKKVTALLATNGYRAKNVGGYEGLKKLGYASAPPIAKTDKQQLAIQESILFLQSLTKMREGLAGQLSKPTSKIVADDFMSTCAPVGKAFKQWAEQKGYEARQVSNKNRNPKHEPNTMENQVLADLQAHQDKAYIVQRSNQGVHIAVRINVVQACLKCHGDRSHLPPFIKQKYPLDKAYGYRASDLRGIYSVLIKDPS